MESKIKFNVEKSIFSFLEYKVYLKALVGPKSKRSGLRAQLAKTINCQPTFVSQVLYSSANFSLEQGFLISDFLGHTKDEKKLFLLMIEKERAGNKSLENYFKSEIDDLMRRRMTLTERENKIRVLPEAVHSIYYSSWHFAAIHVALTIPYLRNIIALSEHFRISKTRVAEVLEFLCQSGMAKKLGNEFRVGDVKVRLGNSSHNIIKHHSNWRSQAVESLERETEKDLHYSGVVSLTEDDAKILKENILDFIHETIDLVGPSKEENVFCLNMDFFNLKRP